MLRQVKLHSREFPDIRRLQTLVTSDASVKFSKLAKQMCGTDVYGQVMFMASSAELLFHFLF